MRKLIPVILILVVAGALYFFLGPSTKKTSNESLTNESASNINSTGPMGGGAATLSASQDQTPTAASAQSAQNSDPAVAKIQTWILTESKNLNQPHVDTKQKDLELKKMIENFSEAEKKIILNTAHDTNKTANERILAAYMMVLDQSQKSEENLLNLAQKALPDFGPVTAHSEAEIRRGQELAVRFMSVDELAKRASNNPEALEALKKLASSAESAEIRGYAQRLLKEIK